MMGPLDHATPAEVRAAAEPERLSYWKPGDWRLPAGWFDGYVERPDGQVERWCYDRLLAIYTPGASS